MAKVGPAEPRYPKLSIGLDHLSEAKEWKIGKTYELTLRVKMTGIQDGPEHMGNGASFDVVGIEPGEQVKGAKDVTRYAGEK